VISLSFNCPTFKRHAVHCSAVMSNSCPDIKCGGNYGLIFTEHYSYCIRILERKSGQIFIVRLWLNFMVITASRQIYLKIISLREYGYHRGTQFRFDISELTVFHWEWFNCPLSLNYITVKFSDLFIVPWFLMNCLILFEEWMLQCN